MPKIPAGLETGFGMQLRQPATLQAQAVDVGGVSAAKNIEKAASIGLDVVQKYQKTKASDYVLTKGREFELGQRDIFNSSVVPAEDLEAARGEYFKGYEKSAEKLYKNAPNQFAKNALEKFFVKNRAVEDDKVSKFVLGETESRGKQALDDYVESLSKESFADPSSIKSSLENITEYSNQMEGVYSRSELKGIQDKAKDKILKNGIMGQIDSRPSIAKVMVRELSGQLDADDIIWFNKAINSSQERLERKARAADKRNAAIDSLRKAAAILPEGAGSIAGITQMAMSGQISESEAATYRDVVNLVTKRKKSSNPAVFGALLSQYNSIDEDSDFDRIRSFTNEVMVAYINQDITASQYQRIINKMTPLKLEKIDNLEAGIYTNTSYEYAIDQANIKSNGDKAKAAMILDIAFRRIESDGEIKLDDDTDIDDLVYGKDKEGNKVYVPEYINSVVDSVAYELEVKKNPHLARVKKKDAPSATVRDGEVNNISGKTRKEIPKHNPNYRNVTLRDGRKAVINVDTKEIVRFR